MREQLSGSGGGSSSSTGYNTGGVQSSEGVVGGGTTGPLLFLALYPCWCHSAISTVALCLLSRAYSHASFIVCQLGEAESEVTVSVLVQIDQLVHLIESPVFAHLRLKLLEPARYPDLARGLYALLMLLPQSAAFHTLHARLAAVPTLALMRLDNNNNGNGNNDGNSKSNASSAGAGGSKEEEEKSGGCRGGGGGGAWDGVDFEDLAETFRSTRRRHVQAVRMRGEH